MITAATLTQAAQRIAARMETAADELNAADGRLGDGDLGVTMARGFRHVAEALAQPPVDVGAALAESARAFTRTSGSSIGTLAATGLLAAAKVGKGRSEVPLSEVPGLIAAALAAMMARGKASLGDKTVLDGLEAVRVALAGLGPDAGADAMTTTARGAAEAALDAFRAHPARVGRARIFADKSVGLDDPGMLALVRILEGIDEEGPV